MAEHVKINLRELSGFYLFSISGCLYKSKNHLQLVCVLDINQVWQEHITGFII